LLAEVSDPFHSGHPPNDGAWPSVANAKAGRLRPATDTTLAKQKREFRCNAPAGTLAPLNALRSIRCLRPLPSWLPASSVCPKISSRSKGRRRLRPPDRRNGRGTDHETHPLDAPARPHSRACHVLHRQRPRYRTDDRSTALKRRKRRVETVSWTHNVQIKPEAMRPREDAS
jgi:hypothetical protein